MTTTTFDTLGYAKKLEEAGFTRPQAEAQASILPPAMRMSLMALPWVCTRVVIWDI